MATLRLVRAIGTTAATITTSIFRSGLRLNVAIPETLKPITICKI